MLQRYVMGMLAMMLVAEQGLSCPCSRLIGMLLGAGTECSTVNFWKWGVADAGNDDNNPARAFLPLVLNFSGYSLGAELHSMVATLLKLSGMLAMMIAAQQGHSCPLT